MPLASQTRVITRDEIVESFRPIASLLAEVSSRAQHLSAFVVVQAANPHVTREAHLHRLSGTMRWILTADGLVDRIADFPSSFGVLSTDTDHNGGQYVFKFPGGVFMVKREPHGEDEGTYVQLHLDQVREQAHLAAGLNGDEPLKAYLSVRPKGSPRLIVEHPTLDKPIVVSLDEIVAGPVVFVPRNAPNRTRVTSTLSPAAAIDTSASDES